MGTFSDILIQEPRQEEPSGWSLLKSSNGDTMYVPDGFTPGEYLSQQEADLQNHARHVYEERLEFGIAREQARKDLPLSNYTEAYWKIDLHNLFNFLRQRLDTHAQLEIREFAQAIAEIVKLWTPVAWEAFVDYQLEACILSREERAYIAAVLAAHSTDKNYHVEQLKSLSKREQQEFLDKFNI